MARPTPPILTSSGPQDQAQREARAAEFLRSSILEAEARFHLSRRGVVLLFGDLVAGKFD